MSDEEYTNGERVGQVLTHGLNSDDFMNKIGISLRGRRWTLVTAHKATRVPKRPRHRDTADKDWKGCKNPGR